MHADRYDRLQAGPCMIDCCCEMVRPTQPVFKYVKHFRPFDGPESACLALLLLLLLLYARRKGKSLARTQEELGGNLFVVLIQKRLPAAGRGRGGAMPHNTQSSSPLALTCDGTGSRACACPSVATALCSCQRWRSKSSCANQAHPIEFAF